jgi:hypothetical protein
VEAALQLRKDQFMNKARFAAVASVISAICSFTPLVHAQATRTWVSGVGDDANPCSRTAPCKTFAGAISKTAALGEIDTLDPGGFGGVTITKSITIDGLSGLAGVLVSGTNAIVVNAANTDRVILRNLDINGFGTGINGILVLAGGDVRVEDCKIYGFNLGIDDRRTSGWLFVTDTVVHNNGSTGILALAASASTLTVDLDHVRMHSNGNAGFAITSGARATVSHSSASSNFHGFYADTGSVLNLDESISSGNLTTGINSQSAAIIRMFSSTVAHNATGLSATTGGSILSYGFNRIAGNGAGNGPPTANLPLQ